MNKESRAFEGARPFFGRSLKNLQKMSLAKTVTKSYNTDTNVTNSFFGVIL